MGNWSRAPGAQRVSGMYHFDGLFLAETPLKLDSGFPQRPLARPTCEASPVRDSYNYQMPQPVFPRHWQLP
ncbi:hypothetical protein EV126DRAFT_98360 [Verticillium dahliae]|nr:hypothetical protein EV126DRAFT_98360 [Verticillium dahliae]